MSTASGTPSRKATPRAVPLVDLADFRSDDPGRQAAFVGALGHAIQGLGFVRVTGHGISPDLVEPAYGAARTFFAKPEEAKRRYFVQGGAGERGYTPFGGEHAKDNPVPDLKEFWHTGRELPAEDPLRPVYPPNLWPDEVPDFQPAMLALYDALEGCSVLLLRALARYLGEDEDRFTRITEKGNTILRSLHYPAVEPGSVAEGAVRAAAHEDINFINLLIAATSSGLEILTRDGEWMAVNAQPGEIVADAGDMLHRVTNGVIPATTHRVVNPDESGEERFSMPFFVHPRPDSLLKVLERFTGPGYPEPPAEITGYAYLQERLRELGLM